MKIKIYDKETGVIPELNQSLFSLEWLETIGTQLKSKKFEMIIIVDMQDNSTHMINVDEDLLKSLKKQIKKEKEIIEI